MGSESFLYTCVQSYRYSAGERSGVPRIRIEPILKGFLISRGKILDRLFMKKLERQERNNTAITITKTLLACGFFVFCLLFYLSNGFELLSVQPKDRLEDYDWTELKTISQEIVAAPTDGDALEVAKKYYLVDLDGRPRIDNSKQVKLRDGTSNSVWISGIRANGLSDDTEAGLVFSFCKSVGMKQMDLDASFTGDWEDSSLREWLNNDFFNNMPTYITCFFVRFSAPSFAGRAKSKASKDLLFIYSLDEVLALSSQFSLDQFAPSNTCVLWSSSWLRSTDYSDASCFAVGPANDYSYVNCTQEEGVIPSFYY